MSGLYMPGIFVFLFFILTIYWSIRGFIGIFQRYNPILVVLYFFFLFPIAYFHMLLLGIFGQSSLERHQEEVLKEVEIQTKVANKIMNSKSESSSEILDDKLEKINELKEKGILNEDEYNEKKKKIIDDY
jgi:hypothetical protein|tara:strand:+ start:305 stop:694 length:390 start_codon:yes stop_codon:yes gene_type:complete